METKNRQNVARALKNFFNDFQHHSRYKKQTIRKRQTRYQ
jgi:hypothetical protein